MDSKINTVFELIAGIFAFMCLLLGWRQLFFDCTFPSLVLWIAVPVSAGLLNKTYVAEGFTVLGLRRLRALLMFLAVVGSLEVLLLRTLIEGKMAELFVHTSNFSKDTWKDIDEYLMGYHRSPDYSGHPFLYSIRYGILIATVAVPIATWYEATRAYLGKRNKCLFRDGGVIEETYKFTD